MIKIILLLLLTMPLYAQETAMQTVPQSVMQSVYEAVKTPYKYGVVIPQEGDKLVDCPGIFRFGEKWYMTYILFNGDGYETALASSDNLLDWTSLGRILPFRSEAWDEHQAGGGPALQTYKWGGSYELETYHDVYWMTYVGGSEKGYEAGQLALGVASTKTPHQPIPWQRLKTPILTPLQDDARNFEKNVLFKSHVIHDPNLTLGYPFVMYYNASDTSRTERIGMAVSDDMHHWKRYGADPVIDNQIGISGDPQITKMGDLWVMFFFGAFWKPNAFDLFACSYDLVHWTQWDGPPLIQPSEPWDQTFAHKPWIIYHDDIVYHFYCAVGDQGRVIALATSKKLR